MDVVIRALAVYVFLLMVFRIAGKRSLGQTTTFDFVLLLIIAQTTQNALLGDDYSVTNSLLLIVTLFLFDIGLSLLKRQWPRLDMILEGLPLVVVEKGRPLEDRLRKARIDAENVLNAARETRGLRSMEQIDYAVLERDGSISIIPKQREDR
ncbi:MAG: DUF421 domain-containing protein [Gammaproteobacteria bacterium]|nr:DUF421 domain-containing protein [Gammaproteobacteria bacterium]